MFLVKESVQSYGAMSPFELQIRYVQTRREFDGNRYDSHVHPQCEIYINLSGDVSFMVENRIYPIFPGDIVITRPYDYHHCIYHSNDPHKHFWILFSAGGNESMFPRFFERSAGEGNLLSLPSDMQQELVELCRRMTEESCEGAEQMYRFFNLIRILNCADIVTQERASYSKDVQIALEYINDHFADPMTVSEIARAAHVSVNTLERHFFEVLHMSPSAYLKKKRLAHAAECLYGGKSVMESCIDSGFPDYSNFIATFKKAYGTTPLKYQKSLMENK